MNLKRILITLSALLLFTSASQAGSIKHWNGSSWLPLGTGDSSITTDAELLAHNGNPTAHQTLIDSIDLKAPLASPALTGTPTAPTAAEGTNTTQIATTEFVATNTATAVRSASTRNIINAGTGYTYPTCQAAYIAGALQLHDLCIEEY